MNSAPCEAAAREFLVLDRIALRVGPKLAFRGASWVVCEGQQWAVLGPNASGKSLLAQAIAGHVPLLRGEIRYPFGGRHETGIASALAPEHRVALVSPHTHRTVIARESSFYQSRWHSGLDEGNVTVKRFLSQDSVEEINPFEIGARRSPRTAFLKQTRFCLDLLRLSPLLRRKLTHLSNGEMRKVLLARALLQSPRLLLLDDPFAGLDSSTRPRLSAAIDRLMRSGLHVVVITNRPDEIPSRTTHLLLVHGHQIVSKGPREEMIEDALVRQLRAEHAGPAMSRPNLARAIPSSSAAPKLVAFNNVTIQFGAKPVLRHFSWTLRQGERWALMGPNGSGKSTLLSLIQGDNPQAYGQDIRVFDRAIDSTQALWQARQLIGWLSPELHLHYPLRWSCLAVACSGFFNSIGLHETCSARQRAKAGRWLRRLGVTHAYSTPLGALSLGDQRLVLLARSVVNSPRLLILDEPCLGLDLAHRQSVLTAVDQVVRATGASLIYVTHHRGEIPGCITHYLRLVRGAARTAKSRTPSAATEPALDSTSTNAPTSTKRT